MSKIFLKTTSLVTAVLLMSIVREGQSAEQQMDGDLGIKSGSMRMNEVTAMVHLRDDLMNSNSLDWGRIVTLLKSEKDYIERGYGKRTRHGPSQAEIDERNRIAAEVERQRLAAIEAERIRQLAIAEEQRQKDLRAAQEGVMPTASALEEEREKLRQQSAEALRATGAAASSRPADVAAEGDFVTSPDDE